FTMPLNIRFGRSSIPVLSVVGALGIGAVFTQLFFQNIQGSTFIYVGWLAAGVLMFVGYRLHRKKSLWQPLAAPPRLRPRPRPIPAQVLAGPTYDKRVHVERHKVRPAAVPRSPAPAEPASASDRFLSAASGMRNPLRLLA